MTPDIARILYGLLIAWFIYMDRKRRTGVSGAVWLPVVWFIILASKRLSAWLALGNEGEVSESEADGSAIDRILFLFLIVGAFIIVKRRNLNWSLLFARNRWLVALYVYLGVSAIWSDFTFISFKRWFNDLGNVVMILLIFTEENPVQAICAVFARCAYFLVPVSVLFIKFFSELGRGYNRFTGEGFYRGVASDKNALGKLVIVLGLLLIWEFIQILRRGRASWKIPDLASYGLMTAMVLWLLNMAKSATSLACMVLGGAGIILFSLKIVRKKIKAVLGVGMAAVVILVALSAFFDLKANMAEMLGRDPTLHGRDQIWKNVLSEHTNPLVGTGYYSFWLGGRATAISAKTGSHFVLNQSHNGYLELYLNGGIIGLFLLFGMMFDLGKSIFRQIQVDPDWGSVRLVFWVINIIHNWSEASYCIISPLWFVLLLITIRYPGSPNEREIPVVSEVMKPAPDPSNVSSPSVPRENGLSAGTPGSAGVSPAS